MTEARRQTPNREASEVEAAIDRLADLRTLPIVVLEAQHILGDSHSCASDLARLLQRDPALSARILRMANSAYYGCPREIGSLSRAVVLLGFQAIRNLTLTVGVIDSFRGIPGEFDYSRLWGHSVATAIAAERIARHVESNDHEFVYMAALLHDLGQLLLVECGYDAGHGLSTPADGGNANGGIDHCEAGARFLDRWQLPPEVIDVARFHHGGAPQLAPEAPPSGIEIVALANSIVSDLGLPSPAGNGNLVYPTSERLGYDEGTLAGWVAEIVGDLERASEFFELVGLGPIRVPRPTSDS